jgi:glycosyltransferase involved in cell wall biosynthesis
MYIGLDGIPLAQAKTGVGHYTFELARALASIAPDDNFELVAPSPHTTLSADAAGPESPLNLHVSPPTVNRLNGRGWWPIGLPLYINKVPIELFHGTNYNVPLWNRCPTVLTIHDLSLLLWPQTHQQHLVRRARWRLPMMARVATAIVVPSQAVKREVCDHLKIRSSKIVVIPEAARNCFRQVPIAETNLVRRRLKIEDDFILFVGTIEPRKNLLTLVRAFEELLRSTSRLPQLVIVGGKGWLTHDFFAYLEHSVISNRVLFPGYLSDDDLRALYSSCQMFVYPSLYEGFGLPLLEAMACGAPVITSDIPSIRETVGNTACLISPTDSTELARVIMRLLKDAPERKKRSAAGIEHAMKFSWEKTASSTLDLYREVMKERKTVH